MCQKLTFVDEIFAIDDLRIVIFKINIVIILVEASKPPIVALRFLRFHFYINLSKID